MLNVIVKKLNPYLYKHITQSASYFIGPTGRWMQNHQNNPVKSSKLNPQNPQKYYTGIYNNADQGQHSEIFDPYEQFEEEDRFGSILSHQVRDDGEIDIQKKKSQEKILNQQSLDESAFKLFHEEASTAQIMRFCKKTDMASRIKNSQELMASISCLLKEKQQKKFVSLIQNYKSSIKSANGAEARRCEKDLFKKIHNLLLNCIQEPQSVKKMLKLFSQCNPKVIVMEEIQRINDVHRVAEAFHERKVDKTNLFCNHNEILEEKQKQESQSAKAEKMTENNLHSAMELVKSSETSRKVKGIKLKSFDKEQAENKKLEVSQQNMQKVEKQIFGNKKIMKQLIIFKGSNNKEKKDTDSYGQNWVYAYDLPYSFDKDKAKQFVDNLSRRFGEIENYEVDNYQDIIEKNCNEIIYTIPDNYGQEGDKTDKKLRIQKIIKKVADEADKINAQTLPPDQKHKKSLVNKILEKIKKENDLPLNRSTILLKLKNYEDKKKFLSPEMRVFGLNLGYLRNIRFQQAQSKNVVALSMIPWACQSSQLIKFINMALSPISTTVTHPNCQIANSLIFLEFSNFYQAIHTKKFLYNAIFQNQRLKAQLCYGSSFIYNGVYKTTLDVNHYENLLNKLTDLSDKYKENPIQPLESHKFFNSS